MKKYLLRIAIGLTLVCFFLLHAAGLMDLRFIWQLELWSYDQRLHLTLPRGQNPRIVIIDIDEKSLAEVGRWPWSRNQVARMSGAVSSQCLLIESGQRRRLVLR